MNSKIVDNFEIKRIFDELSDLILLRERMLKRLLIMS